MARPKSYRCEALVLKSMPVGEAGLIITLYSGDIGKLRGVVRGARKLTSKMGGHLQTLNKVEVSLSRSRPDGIDTITHAQILEGFSSLKGNLEAVSRGIYLAELVGGFGAEDSPNPGLYSLFLDTLRFLNDRHDVELALRYFELHLLNHSGFMPELYRCVECREELSPGKHLFSPEVGGTVCLECSRRGARVVRLSLDALKVLRFLDTTRLAELPRLRIDKGLQEALRNILSVTVKYWLDKEIQSKAFMEHLEHSRKATVPTAGA